MKRWEALMRHLDDGDLPIDNLSITHISKPSSQYLTGALDTESSV
jgi:hypothetical protein